MGDRMNRDPVAAALDLARPVKAHVGKIDHDGLGRTDDRNMDVKAESYVIPSDVVSALGHGNTSAGFKVLEAMFPPSDVDPKSGDTVPIVAAAGEFVLSPEQVAKIGGGDMKRGHGVLRAFCKHAREQNIKTLRKLPGPSRG